MNVLVRRTAIRQIGVRPFSSTVIRLNAKPPASQIKAEPAPAATGTTTITPPPVAPPIPPAGWPEPPKKKRKGFFRRLGQLMTLSALGLVGFSAYKIYVDSHPAEQVAPGPDKKTLVILGTGWGSVSLLKRIDSTLYNVIVISPRNFFLFTPLLPSCTTGTIESRSIMEPIRSITRHKEGIVQYIEAEAKDIDMNRRVVTVESVKHDDDIANGEGPLSIRTAEIPFDYLVVGVGAQNTTFGIPGVEQYGCFLKEITDAQKIRQRIMDRIEQAMLPSTTPEERKRLLHMVVVGGGPTGVEFAGELQDFFEDDLKKWIPSIADDFKVTLVEALPNVLPMFSKQLIEYTEKIFSQEKITVMTKTMVKNVTESTIEADVTTPSGERERQVIPYGLLVWATGNAARPLTRKLMSSIPAQKDSRRGLAVNEFLVVNGTDGVWGLGDCTATKYAPTAQVAAQQGLYLARLFNQLAKTEMIEQEIKDLEALAHHAVDESDRRALDSKIDNRTRVLRRNKMLMPFEYSHQGSLAYIGMDRAVADLAFGEGNYSSGGSLTYIFWRSAYLSMVFSSRNRLLVLVDWLKVKLFGRDVSRE
ncbi:hypothetical protein CANCADRAFT_128582 [Tortispora caseinolytica NRRL Y-17796]|uniref:NADH:ubiquinone reductase (non-electrogenic) n=1 Tax=Tortispora caseinolytica NRRL Y-17796 TaxID=767744 RepID=A0A1E4TAG6_9ASCO|nr:hypothetical protein CANCADRAFT_128582 [Tortispora caseinolytica NRRL Y-17796]